MVVNQIQIPAREQLKMDVESATSSVADPRRSSFQHGLRWAGRISKERIAPPLLFSAIVLVTWEVTVAATGVRETILPRPSVIARQLYEQRELLLDNTWVTIKEILIGFVIALIVGLALGIIIASSRLIEQAVYPWMIASQMVPIVAIAPLLVVWFGFDLRPKVIVVALVSFFPLAVNTVDGLKAPPKRMIDLMRTLGANRFEIFRMVKVPAALPFVFSGAKVAVAFATLGAVFGEWVGASEGLGYLILTLNNQSATADVFATILILSLLGISLFGIVSLIERAVLSWRFHGESHS
jgi:ABC-type nitrate/sulfonate/bicarbonate transport system permease component